MDDATKSELEEVFGLASSSWMMNPAERLAIIGLLNVVRPGRALEIGYGFGGCTRVLSRHANEVHTVDIHERVLTASRDLPNVKAWQLPSQDAFTRLAGEGLHFDFCLLDGNHSEAMAHHDLARAVALADVIVMHDTGNPECRGGYARALAESDVYGNLDWIDGRIQCDGPWGGLGIVLPAYPRNQPYRLTPVKIQNYALIAAACAGGSADAI